jgi:hypothetical protein
LENECSYFQVEMEQEKPALVGPLETGSFYHWVPDVPTRVLPFTFPPDDEDRSIL